MTIYVAGQDRVLAQRFKRIILVWRDFCSFFCLLSDCVSSCCYSVVVIAHVDALFLFHVLLDSCTSILLLCELFFRLLLLECMLYYFLLPCTLVVLACLSLSGLTYLIHVV